MENYSYDYFVARKPFLRVLKEFCDLTIDFYWTGYTDNRHYQYTISYNQKKFFENLPEIKQRLLRTKFCKYDDEMRQKIEAISINLEDYENAYAINKLVSDLIWDGCLGTHKSSASFTWKHIESFSDNMEFNKNCAKKMTRPVIRIREVNGWERESWNFYLDFPSNDLLKFWTQLANRFDKMPRVKQCNGLSYFEISFVPKEYDSINWGLCRGYMPKNNFIDGILTKDTLMNLIQESDDYLFNTFYKGGIRDIVS